MRETTDARKICTCKPYSVDDVKKSPAIDSCWVCKGVYPKEAVS